MARTPSRYEQAWRARRAASLTPQPVAEDVVVIASPFASVPIEVAEQIAREVIVGDATPLLELQFKASSNVKAARLDAATGVVEVEFASGQQYRYANFTSALMTEWRDAKSAGSWLHVNVKSKPEKHPMVTAAALEISDEELEKLTAPAAE